MGILRNANSYQNNNNWTIQSLTKYRKLKLKKETELENKLRYIKPFNKTNSENKVYISNRNNEK